MVQIKNNGLPTKSLGLSVVTSLSTGLTGHK